MQFCLLLAKCWQFFQINWKKNAVHTRDDADDFEDEPPRQQRQRHDYSQPTALTQEMIAMDIQQKPPPLPANTNDGDRSSEFSKIDRLYTFVLI